MADLFWFLGIALKRVWRIGLAILIMIPFLVLFAMMFLLPPVAVVWEGVDIFRMNATAPGQITNVTFETGGKGTSRARIEYAFTVEGQQFVSDRYLPGFAGNVGSWTGGAAIGNDFPVGRAVTVHYCPSDPTSCALEYGWFKWSVSPTAVWLGLVIIALACGRLQPSMTATALWCVGIASVGYGICELTIGPSAVRVGDLQWHALAWCAVLAGAALFTWAKKRFPGPTDASDHSAVQMNKPQVGESAEEAAQVADREHSTPYLVFELLWGMGVLSLVLWPAYQLVLTFGVPAIRGIFGGIQDASQLIATLAVFIGIGVAITICAGLSCAVIGSFLKVTRRIAWHRTRPRR